MPLLDSLGLDKDTLGLLGMSLMNRGNKNDALAKIRMLDMLGENGSANSFNPTVPSVPGIPSLQAPNVTGFNEKLSAALPGIMEDLRAKGWQPTIASGIRSQAEQAEKVRQGYSQTMNSKHLVGKAVDIVDKRYGWDGPAADTNHQFWKDLGEAAKRHGAQWGGDWKNFKDVAHVQVSRLNQNPGLLNQSFYA